MLKLFTGSHFLSQKNAICKARLHVSSAQARAVSLNDALLVVHKSAQHSLGSYSFSASHGHTLETVRQSKLVCGFWPTNKSEKGTAPRRSDCIVARVCRYPTLFKVCFSFWTADFPILPVVIYFETKRTVHLLLSIQIQNTERISDLNATITGT